MENVTPEFERFYHEHVTLRGRVVQPGEERRVIFDKLCEHYEGTGTQFDNLKNRVCELEDALEESECEVSQLQGEIASLNKELKRCENE